MFKLKNLKPKEGALTYKVVEGLDALKYPIGSVFQTIRTRGDANGRGTIIVRNGSTDEDEIFDILHSNPEDRHESGTYGSNLDGYAFILLSCTNDEVMEYINKGQLPIQL